MYFVIRSHNGDARTFSAEEHRVDWHRQLLNIGNNCEMYLPERSWQQSSVLVVYIHLGQQRTGCRIDRLRGSRHYADKFLPGELLQSNDDPAANFDVRRISLRNARVHAQGIDLSDVEEFSSTRSRINKGTGVHIAPREHT